MNFLSLSYFIGLSTMFFGMMAVFFWDRNESLRKLVTLLMAAIALYTLKDFIFIVLEIYGTERYWSVMTALDMVAVPLYASVLVAQRDRDFVAWDPTPLYAYPSKDL